MNSLITDPQYLSLFTLGLLGIMSPGPDFFIILKNAMSFRTRVALWTVPGILLGLLIHLNLNVLGLLFLSRELTGVFTILQYLGSFYLIFLGVRMLYQSFSEKSSFSAKDVNPEMEITNTKDQSTSCFWSGFFINVLNGKAGLFFFSVLSPIIHPEMSYLKAGSYASVFFIQSIFYWSGLVLLIKHTPIHKFLFKYEKPIHIVFGAFLIFFGCQILF
jgi:threonine/homoserine/homoserine lactone efflux protein